MEYSPLTSCSRRQVKKLVDGVQLRAGSDERRKSQNEGVKYLENGNGGMGDLTAEGERKGNGKTEEG